MDYPAVLAQLQEWLEKEVTVYLGATHGAGRNAALLTGTLVAGFDFGKIEAGAEPHPDFQGDNTFFWVRPSLDVPTSLFTGFFVARDNIASASLDPEPPRSLDIHTADGVTIKVVPASP